MGIKDSDTFSVSWISCYENSLNFYCALIVEAYENVFTSENSSMLLALGGMKSKIKMELSNGETYVQQDRWQQAIVAGLYGMQEFLLCILQGMRMEEEEAINTIIELTDALDDNQFMIESDPRMN